jgi:hypothetical protein
MKTKEHSDGKNTYNKAMKMKDIFEAKVIKHKEKFPNAAIGLVELFGSKVHYPANDDRPAFGSSQEAFCAVCKAHDVKFDLVAFEIEKARAEALIDVLVPYANMGRIRIFNCSNIVAGDMLRILKTNGYDFATQGIVSVDPDGVLPLPLLVDVHSIFPEYDALLNFNCNADKRHKGRQSNEDKQKVRVMSDFLLHYEKWYKATTMAQDTHQWALTYVSKEKIDKKKLGMFSFSEPEGLQHLTRVICTEVQRRAGINILHPMYCTPALLASIGLKMERLDE